MKRISAKATPSPSMVVAIIALVVALSGSAYAAVTINGKNIKKGTVASKQIKNGTIVKADLNKKLSVTGPQGPQGVPGAAGATSVSKYVWHSEDVGNNIFEDRDIQCTPGEKLVGGGAGWEEDDGDKEIAGTVSYSGPVIPTGDPASGATPATGWGAAGQNTSGGARDFEVFALCAKP
ncbi:MAG: hypothetical protein ACRDKE_07675 [Solirubrobacterales bacterium]